MWKKKLLYARLHERCERGGMWVADRVVRPGYATITITVTAVWGKRRELRRMVLTWTSAPPARVSPSNGVVQEQRGLSRIYAGGQTGIWNEKKPQWNVRGTFFYFNELDRAKQSIHIHLGPGRIHPATASGSLPGG